MKEDPIRCKSPHVCRRAETGGCSSQMKGLGGSVTPKRLTAAQQNLDRCAKVLERERERMKEVWERLKKEQTALMEARDGLSKLMTKGTTDIWRMKSKMAEQLREYEGRIAAADMEDDQSRKAREWMAKEREEVMEAERSRSMICQGCNRQGCRSAAGRAMGPSSAAARVTPAEAMGRSPLIMRSKDGMTLSAVVRSGTGASEAQALRPFSDSRMVKLLSTGGQMCLCLQLHTENGVATWRQTDVPNIGQSGILLMPVKKTQEGITLFAQEQEQPGAGASGAGPLRSEEKGEPEKSRQPRRQDRTE